MADLWRPSNSTMGEIFASQWCNDCGVDAFDMETLTGESCPVILAWLIGDAHEAVTYGSDGKPVCSMHTEVEVIDPRQQRIDNPARFAHLDNGGIDPAAGVALTLDGVQ